MKVFALGLDAATFDLIQLWAESGELPTFKRLMDEGVWSRLKSIPPYSTYPNWKCISTGKNPGKLGVYGFISVDPQNKVTIMNNSLSFHNAKEIWDYLGEKGFRVGVINMPSTYPPKKLKGFMISGLLVLDTNEYTYPRDLKKALVKKYKYKINRSSDIASVNSKALHELEEIIRIRFLVAKDLSKVYDLDFLLLVIVQTDHVGHMFWKHMEKNDRIMGGVIKYVYQLVDKHLGLLINEFGEGVNIIVFSDHGMTSRKAEFELNSWFCRNGHLHLTAHVNPSIKKRNIYSALNRIGVTYNFIRQIFFSSVLGKILQKTISMEKLTAILNDIEMGHENKMAVLKVLEYLDTDKTKAFSHDGYIYILNLERDTKEYKDFVQKLMLKLIKIKDPRTGEPIIKSIKKSRDLYGDTILGFAPDLVIIPNRGYTITGRLSNNPECFNYSIDPWSSVHDDSGIFIAWGPDIKKKGLIHSPSLYDIAPTLLHLFGFSLPSDMDGRVLKEIFVSNNKEALQHELVTH